MEGFENKPFEDGGVLTFDFSSVSRARKVLANVEQWLSFRIYHVQNVKLEPGIPTTLLSNSTDTEKFIKILALLEEIDVILSNNIEHEDKNLQIDVKIEIPESSWVNPLEVPFSPDLHEFLKMSIEKESPVKVKPKERKRGTKQQKENREMKKDTPKNAEHVCSTCQNTFCGIRELKNHIFNRHHNGSDIFYCDTCKRAFKSINLLRRHIISKCGKKFLCDRCDKSYDSKSLTLFKQHLLTHTGKRPFKCDICPSAFAEKRLIKLHKSTVHSTSGLEFICELCSKAFNCIEYLKNHISRTHKLTRNFKCNVCNYAFSNKRNLLRHMVVHTDERSFICQFCSKGFRRITDLKEHVQIHGEKRYKCDLCFKVFATKTTLNKHCKSHSHKKKID